MSTKKKDKKFLMQNYEKILRNCRESLEKYQHSPRPTSTRSISVPSTHRWETTREGAPCGWQEASSCSRQDFVPHEECFRRLECSKWIEALPPVWDEILEKEYVEYVVRELIEDRTESSRTASGRSEEETRGGDAIKTEPGKKDHAPLVGNSELQGDVQAVWRPVDSRDDTFPGKKSLHYKEITPQDPLLKKKPSLASVQISTKGRVLTTVNKPPIPVKTGSKRRVVASATSKASPTPTVRKSPLKTRPKSLPTLTSSSNKPTTPQSPRNYPVQSKLSPFSRFVGKPGKYPIDFSAEHPGLVLEDTSEALFPCRLNKLDAGDEEKSTIASTEVEVAPIEIGMSCTRSVTEEQDELRSSGVVASSGHIDKTWQEVLMEGALKAKEAGQVLRLGGKKLKKEGKEKVPSPKKKEPPERDVIYDSARIIRPAERAAASKLAVQRLPVLCIRGMECKVQKIVEISIDGVVAGVPREDRANVRFFECSYKVEEIPKSPKGTKNAQNIKIQTEDENEKEVEVVKEDGNQEKLEDNFISIEAIPKYQLTGKTSNRFLAPFLEIDVNEYKIGASEGTSEPPRSSQDPTAVQSTSGGVNDSDDVSGSAQTDDEKLQKGSSSKSSSSSSSYTNPTTSEELQSNQPKESFGTIQSSSGGSHFFQDENIQMKLNDTGEVRNILKEVFSGSEEEVGVEEDGGSPLGPSGPPGDGRRRETATVGIDCSDLMTGIEMSVQTEDIGAYYWTIGPGKGSTNSSDDGDNRVEKIVERICRDETDAFRKFKLRTSPNSKAISPPQGGINTPARRIDFNVTNANDLAIDGRLPGIVRGESIKSSSGGAASKHPISGTIPALLELPSPLLPLDRSPPLDNAIGFRAGNYTDNLGAIKGDEVEERSHQADEVSSSSCLGSHGNLLGRKCYCRQHRWGDDDNDGGGLSGEGAGQKGREFAYEPASSPLRDLYDTNLRLNSPLMQFNYEESPPERRSTLKQMGHNDFQKRMLEANPKFSRTLAKIYDAAPNVTARPSNRMDPEVQRAVKKFLESLLEPQSPVVVSSNRKGRYTKLNNVPAPLPRRAGQSLTGLTSRGWTSMSTSMSSTSTSSPEHCNRPEDHRTFSSLWKSNCDSETLSDTESSDLQRMLYAPLWDDLPIKTKRDNLRELTGSSTSSIEFGPKKRPQPARGGQASHHQSRDISEGEVLSLGEVRSIDS